MDNTEYMIKRDEIRSLIAQREYVQAAEIADTIDWRRIRSVMMLCLVSDLYKINRRYEDARNVMLLAYDIRPGGRSICYSLCELSIKLEEFVWAVSYYNEFVQAAPRDPDSYVLRYKLCEAQDVSLEERIDILKKLKRKEYREKWAYELAYLYHRIGQATLCVEECDELILWFGDGKYVYKAMELKMLHQPLSPSQQEKYDHRFDNVRTGKNAKRTQPTDVSSQEDDQNLWKPEDAGQMSKSRTADGYEQVTVPAAPAPEQKTDQKPTEPDIQVKIMDVGQYNTMNLQAELAAGLQEVLGKEDRPDASAITRAILAPMLESDTAKLDLPDDEEVKEEPVEDVEEVEVFFGETGEMRAVSPDAVQETSQTAAVSDVGGDTRRVPDLSDQDTKIFEIKRHVKEDPTVVPDETARQVMNQMQAEQKSEEQARTIQPPRELAEVLSQESDGQISLVVPERATVEKQITGQMSISDILAEWERRKQENAQKRREEVRQHILQQTGRVFTEFEAALKDELEEKPNNSQTAKEMFELEEPEDAELDERAGSLEKVEETVEWELPEEAEESEEPEKLEARERFGETAEWGLTEEPEKPEKPEARERFGETAEWELTEEAGEPEEPEEPETPERFGETVEWELPEEAGEPKKPEEPEAPEKFGETAEWELAGEPKKPEEPEAPERLGETVEWELSEEAEEPEKPEKPEVLREPEARERFGETAEWELSEEAEEPEKPEEAEAPREPEAPERFGETVEWELSEEAGEPEKPEEPEAPKKPEVPERFGETVEWELSEEAGEPEEPEEAEAPREPEAPERLGETVEWELPEEAEEPEEPEEAEAPERFGETAEWELPEEAGEPEKPEKPEAPKKPEVPERLGETVEWELPEWELPEEAEEPELAEELEGTIEWELPEESEGPEGATEWELPGEPEKTEEAAEPSREPEEKKTETAEEAVEYGKWESIDDEDLGDTQEWDNIGEESYEIEEKRPRKRSKDAFYPAVERDKQQIRELTREEKELFAAYIQSRAAREQLTRALDNISMAAYTGNIVITGEEGMDTLTLAKNMIQEVQVTDSNFSGRVAKISGRAFSQRNVKDTLEQLKNGALIIMKAAGMESRAARELYQTLQQENVGIIIVLEDTKKGIKKLFADNPRLMESFTARVDVEALSDETLASFGRKYAREKEFSIDDVGMLALRRRIEERQTIDHMVTLTEVKKIVDEAIRRASKKNFGHFMDILFARRYDEEDMIILTEKDFM